MERITFFVDVILPLPLRGLYTYRVPEVLNSEVKVGSRVVVQFGKRKIYTALVYSVHQNVPKDYVPKYVLSVLDNTPIVNGFQLKLWEWMAEYYFCHIGEIMQAALPSMLKLASESAVVLHPDFNRDFKQLNEKEYLVAEALDIRQKLSLSEISAILEQKKTISLIQNMLEKKIILLEEELHEKFKPKKEICVRLFKDYYSEENLKSLLDSLSKRAFKQVQILMAFIQLTQEQKNQAFQHIKRSVLLEKADASSNQLNQLVEKNIFELYEIVSSRLTDFEQTSNPQDIVLSNDQQLAFENICDEFDNKSVVLLHGITSSGKTEIYIKLIDETIRNGKQVLFLLPEIALTSQIINRLRKYFGSDVGVYHSKYSGNERVEVWNRMNGYFSDSAKKPYKIILGARSAVFLPFTNLGLIIVDEEHDTSFKQNEPSPRYNGRDTAIYLAGLHNARTLLGSATPSLESYFNALNGKYGLAELKVRYGNIEVPEIEVINLKEQYHKKKMKLFFSEPLYQKIINALKNKEQVILFQNRRGFSTRLECNDCNWIPACKYCDVTLVYHKQVNALKCHYCGYTSDIPEECPACKSHLIQTKGIGTERIEEETASIFSESRVARMDLDSTRSKNAYLSIINDFEDRKTQILIGTQMVTKGLDFDNVGLVGIINADGMLSFPDFRSHERSFQLMTQVSGRSGRRKKQGMVVIQTFNPQHKILQLVISGDYKGMYDLQVEHRKRFSYPPFSKLITISLKHSSVNELTHSALLLAQQLKDFLPGKVFGPEFPVISRIKNLYIKNILIKLNRNNQLNSTKQNIRAIITEFQKQHSSVKISIDVDPL